MPGLTVQPVEVGTETLIPDSQQLPCGQPGGVGWRESSSQEPAKELLLSALLKLCVTYCGLINKETQMKTSFLELLPSSSWVASAGCLHHEKK